MAQALPSGTTDADRFARALARLRGGEIGPADGTLVAEDLRVLGQLLADARDATLRAVAQAHFGSVTEILSELEEEYGLPDGHLLSVAERQRHLLAAFRARSWPAPTAVLTTVRALAAEAVLDTNTSDEVDGTDPSAVFRFALLLSLTHLDDASLMAALDRALCRQASADEMWSIGRNLGFRCGDPDSLCDTDLLAF